MRTCVCATAVTSIGSSRGSREQSGLPAKPVPPMFTPFRLRGLRTEEPRGGVADGDVFLPGRHSRRFLSGASGCARAGRCGAAVHRDDLRRARCAHHAGLRRAVERRAGSGVEAHRRLRPLAAAARRSVCSSATPAEGFHAAGLGGRSTSRCAKGNWPLIAPSAIAYGPHNQTPRAMTRADMDNVREQFVARDAGAAPMRVRHPGAALCARLSAVQLHLPAHQSAHRRVRRVARKSPALSAGSVPRDARRVAARTSRCRCASRRTTGRPVATRRTTRWRSHDSSRPPART